MWHTRSKLGLAILLGALVGMLFAGLGRAQAQNAKELAKKHYSQGQEYFEDGRFAEAEAAFQRAYDASPHPIVLVSIAESRAGQGDFGGAVRAFERYLKDSPNASDRAKIEARINEIKAKPGKLAIRSSPVGASITIDGKTTTAITPTSVELEPGTHEIVLRLENHQDLSKKISVEFGSNEVVQFNLRPVEGETVGELESEIQDDTAVESEVEVDSEIETASSSDVPVGAFVAGGVGAAGLISGVVFGLLALDAQSEFDTNPTDDTADKGETYALVADISYGVAIAGAVTAVILWATHDGGSEESVEVEKDVEIEKDEDWAKVSVQPVLSPNYAGINTALSF